MDVNLYEGMGDSDMTLKPCFPFIVGRGRFGTSLLRAMLDSHPEMAIPRESHFVVTLGLARERYQTTTGLNTDMLLQDLVGHYGFQRLGLSPHEVTTSFLALPPDSLVDAIRRVFAMYAQSQGKSRYGDKTPGYVMSMELLADLFPESRFIHVIRDGRDVSLVSGGGMGAENSGRERHLLEAVRTPWT